MSSRLDYQAALTMKSRNVKTGPMPVSTTSYDTCPDACGFKRTTEGAQGCYAEGGPLGMFWRKVTERKTGLAWQGFLAAVATIKPGTLWRHNQAGDLPGDRETIDAEALRGLVAANEGKRGFTFTHYDVVGNVANREAVAAANAAGFRVNLSADTLAHADRLAATEAGPVVVVLSADVEGPAKIRTPEGRPVVVCPATYRDDVSCMSCGLCSRLRGTIVGFPAHGSAKRRASAVAMAA